ncbi:MAG: hypothetical protein H0X42_10505 [Solirubrobacterales bacterium]|nr:hypothetical protein [Solirubrobacterales bacterium]
METLRSTWTDERLDDLKGREETASERMDRRFAESDARFDANQRRIDQLIMAFVGIQITGYTAVIGFIAVRGS